MQTVLTVSQLNKKTKQWLEQGFANVQVKGELSNVARPASKHLYFTLKDESAQIKCAYFRNAQNPWSQSLENGQSVVLAGKVTLYEARGDYQLIVSDIIPNGEGILLQQIERLKQKLNSEGLFDPLKKKPIPKRPKKIAIITSGSGAAVHDILTTLEKRYPLAMVTLYCCEVQGTLAAMTIIRALKTAMSDKTNEVLIIARGGGSLEDLMPFNDEQLARAIFQCPIPVISGVGHETDISICDFVADLRAATPTTAAQICCPDQAGLQQDISRHLDRTRALIRQILLSHRQTFGWLTKQLLTPTGLVFNQRWQTVDYLQLRLNQAQKKIIIQQQNRINIRLQQIYKHHPGKVIQTYQHQFSFIVHRLQQSLTDRLKIKKQRLENIMATLHALSPLATLNRGYSIAVSQGRIITAPSQVSTGDMIDLKVKYGELSCRVLGISKGDNK